MRTDNLIFSATGIKRLVSLMFFIVLGITQILAQSNQVNVKPEVVSLKEPDSIDWKVFGSRNGVSVYYTDLVGLSCKGYSLKIVNDNKESMDIDFAVGGKLAAECRGLYSRNIDFQYRKLSIKGGETLIGSEQFSALLIPNADNSSIQQLLQNFNIQNSGK